MVKFQGLPASFWAGFDSTPLVQVSSHWFMVFPLQVLLCSFNDRLLCRILQGRLDTAHLESIILVQQRDIAQKRRKNDIMYAF